MPITVSRLHATALYPILLLLLSTSIYAYIFDAKLDLQGDNAKYYLLGKALHLGAGYIDLAPPIRPQR